LYYVVNYLKSMETFKKIMNFFIKKYKPSETEKEIDSIVESMLKQNDTECITAPLATKYYIFNEELQYFIMVSEYDVKITNHTFSYHYTSNPQFGQMLIGKVINFIEADRKKFEEKVFKNEIQMLKKIKNKIQSHSIKNKVVTKPLTPTINEK